MLFPKSIGLAACNSVLNEFDLWLLPTVALAAWFYYPHCQTGPSLCVWKALFHRPCIGCGLTRGICFLVHGRMHEALRFNPLSVVVLLLMCAAFLKSFCDRWKAAGWKLENHRE